MFRICAGIFGLFLSFLQFKNKRLEARKFVNRFQFSIFLHKWSDFLVSPKTKESQIKQISQNIILVPLFIEKNDPILYICMWKVYRLYLGLLCYSWTRMGWRDWCNYELWLVPGNSPGKWLGSHRWAEENMSHAIRQWCKTHKLFYQ